MRAAPLKLSLKKGVGRRILALFVVAALTPMLFTLGLAQYEISKGHSTNVSATLKARAKEFGTDIKMRLDFTSRKAEELLRRVSIGEIRDPNQESYFSEDFDSIWNLRDAPPVGVSRGGSNRFDVTEIELDFVRAGKSKLLISDEGRFVLLGYAAESASPYYAFMISDQTMWGDRETLPLDMEFCVNSATGKSLYCTWSPPDELRNQVISSGSGHTTSLSATFTTDGVEQNAVLWQLFLEGSFGAESLDIVVTQPKLFAKQTSTEIKRVLVPAVLLVLVLVCILSFYQIRGQLRPLHYLTGAAGRLARGDFSSPVVVTTGDEFESLGSAFNNMATRIGRQISTLEAMSGVDQLILSGAKLSEISNDVTLHLTQLTGCGAAGLVVRDQEVPNNASLHTRFGGSTDLISIEVLDPGLFEPRNPVQYELNSALAKQLPFTQTYLDYGQRFVVAVPTTQNDAVNGLLLLGFEDKFDMRHPGLEACVDLASRIAVAVSSVEREEALYRQAHFDALTGLPNRQLLKDRLSQYLTSARVDSQSGAILFLDLDRFKEINDVFGHSVGDSLLTQAAERITAQVRERDTVARLGGDEFVVLLPNVGNDTFVRATADRLLESLNQSFTIGDTDHYVSASIGIAMFPEDGATVETLLKNADAAMYRAKDSGRNRFEFFSKQLNAESRRKITIERDLRTAFQRGDLEVYYQPQFEIATNEVSGAEALLRWHHPKRGAISPSEFIPLAEDSELIVEIGEWVLEQACADLRSLLERDLHPGTVSINVSARQLADKSLRRAVLAPMKEHGINPAYMQLEVTETTVAQNKDIAVAALQSLRDEGVRVAIDDFGTGYSSLSYLEQMPFDVIKIDKSFIDRIGTSKTSDNICRTIIRMAEQLGKRSIAEGVETEAQLQFLRDSRCDYLQGYYFSKPLSATDFKDFVAKQDLHTKRRKALEII